MPSSLSGALEPILDRFEDAWNGPAPPRIEDYLAAGEPSKRLQLLIELVRVDLERRLATESISLSDYLQRFSELRTAPSAVVDLLIHEFMLRRRSEPELSPVDYLARFPEYRPQLQARLSALDTWPTLPPPDGHTPSSVDLSPSAVGLGPGCRLGAYELREKLGGGGMGVVFRARHVRLKKDFALKVLSPSLACNREAIRRFERETEALGRLEHVHLVRASDAGVEGNTPFVVMELLDGMDLAALTNQLGPWPAAEACEAVRQAALGLQHAHERGLVHRDIKPANLWLTSAGAVKVLDMGLARLCDEGESRSLTRHGGSMGTPDYIAPEQVRDSHTADIRADLYSLGCTLFHLLAGEAPFGNSAHPTIRGKHEAHLKAPPRNVRQCRPDVPAELAAVVTRLLAKRPEDRYAAPAEVAAALAPFAAGARLERLLTADREARPPQVPAVRKRSRRKWLTLGIGMAATVAVGLMVWWLLDRPIASPPAKEPIKVGILFSLRGPMQNGDSAAYDAAHLAIEELNKQGGLLGRTIVATDGDGESDYRKFAKESEKLINEDHVCAIFGCRASSNRKAVRPIVEKYDNLLFYPMQFEGLEESPNIIYLGAAPNQQMLPAIDYMFGIQGRRRLFLVGSDYVYPRAANAILRDHVSKKYPDAQILGEKYIPFGSTEVHETIRAIVKQKPDLIVNTINGDSNSAFFRGLYQACLRAEGTPVLSFSMGENDLLSLGEVGVGHYAAWSYFQSIDRPENRDFVGKFRARFGSRRVVSDPMETVYFGVHLWARAVRAAGSVEPRAVAQAIKGSSLEAPEGKVRIDPDTRYTWRVMRLAHVGADGQFEILFNSERPQRPQPFPPGRSRAAWEKFLGELYMGWGNRWQAPPS